MMSGGIVMNILVLGKDERYRVLIDHLSEKYSVECIGFNDYKQGSYDCINKYDMIILPMNGLNSLKIDQGILNKIKNDCIIYTGIKPKELEEKQIISFMDDPEINKKNNELTVEGIIDHIKDKKKNKICILGYGCIGKMLYEQLSNKYDIVLGVNKVPNNGEKFFFTSNLKSLSYNLSIVI